jgi:hypothetical protein
VVPVKCAICRSEKPSDLALASNSALSGGIGATVSRKESALSSGE